MRDDPAAGAHLRRARQRPISPPFPAGMLAHFLRLAPLKWAPKRQSAMARLFAQRPQVSSAPPGRPRGCLRLDSRDWRGGGARLFPHGGGGGATLAAAQVSVKNSKSTREPRRRATQTVARHECQQCRRRQPKRPPGCLAPPKPGALIAPKVICAPAGGRTQALRPSRSQLGPGVGAARCIVAQCAAH